AGALLDDAAREVERARRLGVSFLTLEDDGYPALLRVSADPPPFLYVLGALEPRDVLAVAVVGSRRATPHGLEVAAGIAGGLAAAGFTVVSGLARGIDASGHRGALGAGGRTLAVLGSGIDRIYPVEHRRLAGAIAARGAILSEWPLGTAPLKHHFPARNRVIACLAWSTVVVEGRHDSGSLITASLALDEGRTVHAVPGPVGAPNAEGPNALLREGALPCRSAEDVIEDLGPQIAGAAREAAPAEAAGTDAGGPVPGGSPAGERGAPLPPDQRRVLAAMPAAVGVGIERLGAASGLPPGALLAALLELELRGIVRRIPGPRYVRTASDRGGSAGR
ncbi:MAG: DNA-processing protein DprA, partial [Candidatus Polarisedimenticolia bacterium]